MMRTMKVVLVPIALVIGWVFARVAPDVADRLIPWMVAGSVVLFVLGVMLDCPVVRRRLRGRGRPV